MNAPVDQDKVARNAVQTVRPKAPAAKAKVPGYRDFETFMRLLGQLREYCQKIQRRDLSFGGAGRLLREWQGMFDVYKKFDALRNHFEREELYLMHRDESGEPEGLPDICGNERSEILTRRVASEHVGVLIGSFPNAGPHSPEVYVRMLVEEIIIANPRASILDAACRQLRRTKNFAPTAKEVLDVLRDLTEQWEECLYLDEAELREYRATLVRKIAADPTVQKMKAAYRRGKEDAAVGKADGPSGYENEDDLDLGCALSQAWLDGTEGVPLEIIEGRFDEYVALDERGDVVIAKYSDLPMRD